MKFYTCIFLIFTICLANVDVAEKHFGSDGDTFLEFVPSKVRQTDDEYLDWRSMRINGKLPLLTSKESLLHLIGQADSTVAPDDVCVSFYDEPFEYAYFKGIKVEIYGDTTVITSLHFKTNHDLFVKAPRITLNHKTTLSDLNTLFPKAVMDKREVDIYRLGKAIAIELRTAKDPSDDAWLLFFSDGKLIRMDYWMPC